MARLSAPFQNSLDKLILNYDKKQHLFGWLDNGTKIRQDNLLMTLFAETKMEKNKTLTR